MRGVSFSCCWKQTYMARNQGFESKFLWEKKALRLEEESSQRWAWGRIRQHPGSNRPRSEQH